MSTVERLKLASEGLFYVQSTHQSRHTMRSEIDALSAREAETISDHAKEIAKTFGIYKQRERNESGKKDGDFIFMVRVKNPAGGELTPAQWLATRPGCRPLRRWQHPPDGAPGCPVPLRTRAQSASADSPHQHQLPSDNGYQLTTLGACGDVNRNTVASPIDDLDAELPLDSGELAHAVAREMAPRSSAYYQVFLTDQKGQQIAPLNPEEPIYGAQYLPRKFKVGFAHPHDNSVDLLTQDVGFLPRISGRTVAGYDLYSGGGMGATHNNPATMPLLALHLGVVQRGAGGGHGARDRDDSARAWRTPESARRAMEVHDSPPRASTRSNRVARAFRNRARGRGAAPAAAGARSFGMASGSRRRRLSLRRNLIPSGRVSDEANDQISHCDQAHRRRGRRDRRAHHAQSASDTRAHSGRAPRMDRADAGRSMASPFDGAVRRFVGSRWRVRRSRPAAWR